MILIVDNDLSWAGSLARLFPEDRIVTSDIFEALRIARREQPSAIICDIYLGKNINGGKYLKNFQEASPDSRIVFMTGLATEEEGDRLIEAGAWSYVEKLDAIKIPEFIYGVDENGLLYPPSSPRDRHPYLRLVV